MKNYNTTKTNSSSSKRIAIIALVVFLAVAGCYAAYRAFNKTNSSNTVSTSDGEDTINYSPPTETEKQSGDTKKQELNSSSPSPTKQPSSTTTQSKKAVTVVVTSSEVIGGNVEVAGYAEGIIEKDGVCTATFTQNNKKVTQQQTALDDAQYTSCGVISVPVKKLSKGTWKVTLSYSSSKHSGTSSVESITIK